MKILIAAQQSPHAYPIPAYSFWIESFRNALKEGGHTLCEVPEADWAKGLLPLSAAERSAWKDQLWSATLRAAREERPDFFLGYFFPQQVDSAAIGELRRLGIPSVNFFCDHVRDYTEAPLEFAPFDLHWVPESRALPWYRNRGWKYLHAPMPTWVNPALRNAPGEDLYPPTFIGTADGLRKELLGRAIRAGAEIEIRGSAWKNEPAPNNAARVQASLLTQLGRQWTLIKKQGPNALLNKMSYRNAGQAFEGELARQLRPAPASSDDVFKILKTARIAIGINRYPSFRHSFARPDVYSRLRDIEAPMAGACYLTEWTEDLSFWYELGKEIETFRDSEELVSKIAELEGNAQRRRSLRERGQRRALSELTIGKTLQKLGQALGLASS